MNGRSKTLTEVIERTTNPTETIEPRDLAAPAPTMTQTLKFPMICFIATAAVGALLVASGVGAAVVAGVTAGVGVFLGIVALMDYFLTDSKRFDKLMASARSLFSRPPETITPTETTELLAGPST